MPVPYLDHQRPLAFAHRGGAAHHPENSWPAFEHAVSLGYAYLETDARATSDGVLLAFHDSTLDRVTDGTGEIAALPYSKVRAARVHGEEPIPLMEDLLGAWPGLRFNIDVKHEGSIRPLADVIRRTGAWDRVCITSFSGGRLRQARKAMDRPVCTAATPGAVAALWYTGVSAPLMARRIARSGAQCAQIPGVIANRSFIRRARALGLQVHVWTLNTEAAMGRALDLDVDGVMTDNIVLLRNVLTKRNQWNPRSVDGRAPGAR